MNHTAWPFTICADNADRYQNITEKHITKLLSWFCHTPTGSVYRVYGTVSFGCLFLSSFLLVSLICCVWSHYNLFRRAVNLCCFWICKARQSVSSDSSLYGKKKIKAQLLIHRGASNVLPTWVEWLYMSVHDARSSQSCHVRKGGETFTFKLFW